MPVSRKLLCIVYAFVGLVALVVCWANNIQLFADTGFVDANVGFWKKTFVNPASRSITVDILCLGLAAIIWMLLEARRLSMRGAWLWIPFGLFVVMGAAFPWFLIHRELVLAKRNGSATVDTLNVADIVGVLLIAIPIFTYAVFALMNASSGVN